MPSFDVVLATQDWHPADHGSFAENHAGKQVGDHTHLEGHPRSSGLHTCVQGTCGAGASEALDQEKIQEVVQKGQDPKVDATAASTTTTEAKEQDLRKRYEIEPSITYSSAD